MGPTLTIEELGIIAAYARSHPDLRPEEYNHDPHELLRRIREEQEIQNGAALQGLSGGKVPDLSGQDEQ